MPARAMPVCNGKFFFVTEMMWENTVICKGQPGNRVSKEHLLTRSGAYLTLQGHIWYSSKQCSSAYRLCWFILVVIFMFL